MKILQLILAIIIASLILLNCATFTGMRKNLLNKIGIEETEYYQAFLTDIRAAQYDSALVKIDSAKAQHKYLDQDKLLYYLDRGITLHYAGHYAESNEALEEADRLIYELFTKSIAKTALAWMTSDSELDYSGEIYEDIYVNIFKAMNYLGLNDLEAARVEVKRVNIKLSELETKYKKYTDTINDSTDSKIKIKNTSLNFYSDALAHYLSYLIFRGLNEKDNSRISHQKMLETWTAHPHIYDFEICDYVQQRQPSNKILLNIIAFTGNAPAKKEQKLKITSLENFIIISDPASWYKNDSQDRFYRRPKIGIFPFPGAKPGYDFDFSFPVINLSDNNIFDIEVYIDGQKAGELALLEDMNKVASESFQLKEHIIYLKSITRTIAKGLAAHKTKEKVKGIWGKLAGELIKLTERADLRSWRTMPGFCYVGEFPLKKGKHDISVRFIGQNNSILHSENFPNYRVKKGLNLIQTPYPSGAIAYTHPPQINNTEKIYQLSGNWTGEVKKVDGDSYAVRMNLHRDSTDSVLGEVRYPALNCSGTLNYVGTRGKKYVFREYNNKGTGCIDNGIIHLSLKKDKEVSWESFRSTGQKLANGILRLTTTGDQ